MKKVQKILVVACLAVSGLVFMAARGTETHTTVTNHSAPVVAITPAAEMVENVTDLGSTNATMASATVTSKTASSAVNSTRDLTLKEKIAVRAAEKMVKRQMKVNDPGKTAAKSQLIALLLCIFLGYLGVHRFYLGYTGIGVLMLLTGGLCGILTLIDLIRIITGDLQPKGGSYDETL